MRKAIKASIVTVFALMMTILAANLAFAATAAGTKVNLSLASTAADITETDGFQITADQVQNPEQLKALIPATAEEAESNIYPVKTRFIMWTRDGVHVMWGVYGRGHFVGTDNLGKRCWGLYGSGVFAGFYDGGFFWGRYYMGTWKAQGLFGLAYSNGKFVTFPRIMTANVAR